MRPISYDVQDALREFAEEGLTSIEAAALLAQPSLGAVAGALTGLWKLDLARREAEPSRGTKRAVYRYWPILEVFQPSRRIKQGWHKPGHGEGCKRPRAKVAAQPALSAEFLAYWSPLDAHVLQHAFGASNES